MDAILNQLLIDSNETKNFIEEFKIKQNDHNETMKDLTKVLAHFSTVIEKSKEETQNLINEKKKLKKEFKHSSDMRIEKIMKWRQILGVTYKDLYPLNNSEKRNKLFSIMTLENEYLDSDIKKLLIIDVSNSIFDETSNDSSDK